MASNFDDEILVLYVKRSDLELFKNSLKQQDDDVKRLTVLLAQANQNIEWLLGQLKQFMGRRDGDSNVKNSSSTDRAREPEPDPSRLAHALARVITCPPKVDVNSEDDWEDVESDNAMPAPQKISKRAKKKKIQLEEPPKNIDKKRKKKDASQTWEISQGKNFDLEDGSKKKAKVQKDEDKKAKENAVSKSAIEMDEKPMGPTMGDDEKKKKRKKSKKDREPFVIPPPENYEPIDPNNALETIRESVEAVFGQRDTEVTPRPHTLKHRKRVHVPFNDDPASTLKLLNRLEFKPPSQPETPPVAHLDPKPTSTETFSQPETPVKVTTPTARIQSKPPSQQPARDNIEKVIYKPAENLKIVYTSDNKEIRMKLYETEPDVALIPPIPDAPALRGRSLSRGGNLKSYRGRLGIPGGRGYGPSMANACA